jgi:hypothetical protein
MPAAGQEGSTCKRQPGEAGSQLKPAAISPLAIRHSPSRPPFTILLIFQGCGFGATAIACILLYRVRAL